MSLGLLPDVTVELGITIPGFVNWDIRGGMYVNDLNFFYEVLQPADEIEAITYTVNGDLVKKLGNVKSIIYHKAITPLPKRLKQARVTNMHTKLYIVDGIVWVGSMNLVSPSKSGLHNLMVQLKGEHVHSAMLYYKRVWQAIKSASA